MKILFVMDEFPALSETFVLNQITGLIDRGYDVDVYAGRPRKDPVVHEEVVKYNLLQRTYYYDAATDRTRRLLKAVASFPVYGRIFLRKSDIAGSREFLSRAQLAHAAICLPWNSSYDIIYCHFGPNGNRGRILREIGAIKGKLVTTFHGYDISLLLRQQNEDIYEQLFSSGDLFLPVCENWKKQLIERGCAENKVVVHKMGIDFEKFRYSPRQTTSGGQIRFVSIARLIEKKGIEYGIRAVAKILKIYENIQYTIIGEGPLEASLKKVIGELGVSDNIELAGGMSQHEIIRLLDKAHILLAPSVTSRNGDQEGIPVVLMEAMAMGMPVISTRHSGIPELIQDGLSGFLVPEQDVDALYEKLKYLVEHPEIWADMAGEARNKVARDHDINKLNDRLLSIFNTC